MKITLLKGGSLSTTCLYETQNDKFVRKSVSTSKDREYGFMRWYSQLKKLQRYQTLFPDLVPKILELGSSTNQTWFDLEYLESFEDIKTIFSTQTLTDTEISKINNALWLALDKLHLKKYQANPGAGSLYFKEEVLQKLIDAKTIPEFKEFYDIGSYVYHGKNVPGIDKHLNKLETFFNDLELEQEEYIHGNPTLENTMYSFKEDKIIFIDLYEESIIDSRFLDYSQVLQCSNSLYGYINDRQVNVQGNTVGHDLEIPKTFETFNRLFKERIDPGYTEIINILEATQFTRMLPFKCFAGNINKAKYFYVHACYLIDKIMG